MHAYSRYIERLALKERLLRNPCGYQTAGIHRKNRDYTKASKTLGLYVKGTRPLKGPWAVAIERSTDIARPAVKERE
jgi:hypothetical protein